MHLSKHIESHMLWYIEDTIMELYIASDHAGFECKHAIGIYMQQAGHIIHDCGTHSDTRVNYPEYAYIVCNAVLHAPNAYGILICGSGIGMSIYANRFKGIRAALCTSQYHSAMARKHNNANVICIGARVTGIDVIYAMLDVFLITEYEAGRHEVRVQQLDSYHL